MTVSEEGHIPKRYDGRKATWLEGEDIQSTSQRIFSGLAGSYERSVEYATLLQDRRWKSWVLEKIQGGSDPTLDIGCGTLLLEERLGGRRRFVGLDLSREMMAIGRAKGLDNVALVINGDAESLPFADGVFGTVVSCYVAKYVRTSWFARELARVTRGGGLVALYDFARPRGAFAPFLELYIQGGLRWAGLLLGLVGRSSSFTYSSLPRIIEDSAWDREVVKEMEEQGFRTLAAERLTGGAVFAYSGRRNLQVTG